MSSLEEMLPSQAVFLQYRKILSRHGLSYVCLEKENVSIREKEITDSFPVMTVGVLNTLFSEVLKSPVYVNVNPSANFTLANSEFTSTRRFQP